MSIETLNAGTVAAHANDAASDRLVAHPSGRVPRSGSEPTVGEYRTRERAQRARVRGFGATAPSRRLIAMIAATVVALAIGAFTLSFDALRELATVAGLNRSIAWLWPLIVDGFILLATAAAVALRDRGPRVTWYPWATLIVFAAISVAGNALHASGHANRAAVSVTVASIVSAVPAVALLLASHLLVVLLSPPPPPASWSDGSDSARRAAPSSNTTARGRVSRAVAAADRAMASAPVQVTSEAHGRARTGTPRRAAVEPELGAWLAAERAAGRSVTGNDVARFLNVSPATGRRRLAALRAMQLDEDAQEQRPDHVKTDEGVRAERS
ncbi:DUF2637 domain-containing protein [Jiangella sp. DSM 45060]|uniref:DUF2637 domain-containing protein n=1 Tax=Jiangella sp. DSM 45060 TaxID=1798224 RepID=UPI00087A1CC7|nr:DUF2637 domain-containing protein [Jiangella sp. DSM 45060]SDT36482.1 Protein of unknown function [Jiangella sp. DSM 45060]